MKKIPQLGTIRNEAPRSIGSNQEAIISIRPGYTRLREHIELSGGLELSDIKDISVWINGQILRQLGSGEELDKRNQYHGQQSFSESKVLTISHVRDGLRRFVETHASGIGMATGVQNAVHSLEIKFQLGDSIDENSAIESHAEVTSATAPGLVLRETVETFEYGTNGEKLIQNFIQSREEIDQIFLEYDGFSIDYVEIHNLGRPVSQRSPAVNNKIINDGGHRIPQDGFWAFDKSERGFGKEPLIVTPNSRFEIHPRISGITGEGRLKVRKVSFLQLGA